MSFLEQGMHGKKLPGAGAEPARCWEPCGCHSSFLAAPHPPKRGLREGKAAERAGGTACLIPSLVPGAPLPLPPPQSLRCALRRSPTALGELQRCQ